MLFFGVLLSFGLLSCSKEVNSSSEILKKSAPPTETAIKLLSDIEELDGVAGSLVAVPDNYELANPEWSYSQVFLFESNEGSVTEVYAFDDLDELELAANDKCDKKYKKVEGSTSTIITCRGSAKTCYTSVEGDDVIIYVCEDDSDSNQ